MEGETEERESMGDGLPFPLVLVELFLRVGKAGFVDGTRVWKNFSP
jgi:hypothetical protein